MHARIEQLLSLRDGEPVDASLAPHVSACAHCAAELQRLSAQRNLLQSLPMHEAPNDWTVIEQRLAGRSLPLRPRHWVALGAILVLGALFVIAHRQPAIVTNDPRNLSNAVVSDSNLLVLQERSRALEHALQTLPNRPAVERVGTAATIDGLEHRIQWLDVHLSDARDLDQEQTAQLWQERVALLDTLVKVRYAESGAYVFDL
jgi:hypothetical protein